MRYPCFEELVTFLDEQYPRTIIRYNKGLIHDSIRLYQGFVVSCYSRDQFIKLQNIGWNTSTKGFKRNLNYYPIWINLNPQTIISDNFIYQTKRFVTSDHYSLYRLQKTLRVWTAYKENIRDARVQFCLTAQINNIPVDIIRVILGQAQLGLPYP